MRIYIGNIPFSANEHDVRAHFEQHGVVSDVKLMTDRDTGKLRGFGFVTMDDEGGARAISALDGQDFLGRRLTVNTAKEKPASSGGGYRNGGERSSGGYRGGDRERRYRD